MTASLGTRWCAGVFVLIGALGVALAPTATADDDGYHGAPTVRSGRPVPTVNGVPCVGGKLGVCVGFEQNSPNRPSPRSTIGRSATAGS